MQKGGQYANMEKEKCKKKNLASASGSHKALRPATADIHSSILFMTLDLEA